MSSDLLPALRPDCVPWNKGRILGQKRPLMPRHVWFIGVRLGMAGNARDLALFNMAVDSRLRGCDHVALRVRDVLAAGRVKERALMIQGKTVNLRAVQLLLCHTKIGSTVCYHGVDIEDGLSLSADRPVANLPTGADGAGRPEAGGHVPSAKRILPQATP